jgi:hypothetical protein
MSSLRRIDASRANGAKSRGPITAEGKLNSSRNATRHGLLARTVVLDGEDVEAFTQLLQALTEQFNPSGPVENALIETMAVARWREMRLWAMEKAGLAHQIALEPEAVDPITKAALAFKTLSDQSRSMELINRYETRYDRQFNRCLVRLTALKNNDFSKRT